ncbi:type II secretion system protein [Pontiellaceae bacterium B12227]|nr:type II secretion system protein [Pontiellaceae bacterium B12227]
MKPETEHLNKDGCGKPPRSRHARSAFTLLELLVAMVIMVIALSIAFQAYSGTIRGWKRGTEVMEGIKHGDFAISQLVRTLNSTIFFDNRRKTYAFTIEKESNSGLPADIISFVTSSGAFMPHDSPFASGPHRIKLYIDDDEGAPALFVTAMPAVPNSEEEEEDLDYEPFLVSREVQGLEILIWDEENEDWTEEWEPENSVPERIMLTVFVASDNPDEEPIEFNRVINIPVSASLKDKIASPTLTGGSTGGTAGGATRGSTGGTAGGGVTVGNPGRTSGGSPGGTAPPGR